MIVLKQPEKATVSLIVVDSLPTENIHNRLDKLKEISDIIFVFKTDKIDYEKFTSLYQGCGYVVDEKKSIVELMKFAMEYCLEIFKMHISFLVCPELELLGLPGDIDFTALRENCIDGFKTPIMISRRLSSDEFKQLYTTKYNWFGKELENDYGKYSSHVSISPLIMLSNGTTKLLLDISNDTYKTFLNSVSHWIASTVERNGLKHINKNPWEK